jgi:hypothetical protein
LVLAALPGKNPTGGADFLGRTSPGQDDIESPTYRRVGGPFVGRH